ncbi:OmpA family protein [Bosea vaviloviae]|uniref:OmpA family protein n=1 Tax=Bosea vaviloviae TaxID=1526658 RepID=UPI0020BF805E|nr:OmpA family protein [Bosea vaviloviae]
MVNGSRDALQFKGDGLFDRNADKPRNRAKLELIARILRDELACYVHGEGSTLPTGCNANLVVIDALQVEGHTDSDGSDAHNMDLSARRGAAVYTVMVAAAPEILAFKNLRSQPILSVAGYGKGRPIRENNSDEAKDANRRIDLRLIMFSPTEEKFVPQNLSHLVELLWTLQPNAAR